MGDMIMEFMSTRDAGLRVSSAAAIVQGLSKDGGLFVPVSFPSISLDEITAYAQEGYQVCAAKVMSKYLTDFTYEELEKMTKEAYAGFDVKEVVPVTQIQGKNQAVMELYHGPTLAFKDMALQMLPRLMAASIRKTGEKDRVLILVATSGDTGKAALEGFSDVPGTSILVFYPDEGVANMQKLQMITQKGENVAVCAVKGNFDDTQTGVKKIFSDPEIKATLKDQGYRLSSANSINWGRLVPQIAYYFWAYSVSVGRGSLKAGEPMDFVVPTGNFGDILAGYYAKRMGLPVGRLVCASNDNKILSDFFATGVYDRVRSFYKTSSPSMDILISSNLERLLFEASGRDDKLISGLMGDLFEKGSYRVSGEMLKKLTADFDGDWCTEKDSFPALKELFEQSGELIDTHTAVAQAIQNRRKDGGYTVVLSTASPYKFPEDVLRALGQNQGERDFDAVEKLAKLQAAAVNKAADACVPAQIKALKTAQRRFEGVVCTKEEMPKALYSAIKGWEEK